MVDIDGLSDSDRAILEMNRVPKWLIEIIDEWTHDNWHNGCNACQGDGAGCD